VSKALCLLPATLNKTFMAKSACNLIELFILGDEQNIDLMVIRDHVIPQIFHITQHMSEKGIILFFLSFYRLSQNDVKSIEITKVFFS
jgi:hypothetical protein